MSGQAFSRRVVVSILAALTLIVAACGGPDPTPTPLPTPTEIPTLEEEELEPEDVPDAAPDDAAEEDAAEDVAEEENGTDADMETTPEPAEEPTEEPADEPDDTEPAGEATPEPGEEPDEAESNGEAADEETLNADALNEDETWLASIILPDGAVCRHAGRGATLAFDEKRVNYTCEEEDAADADEDAEDRVLLGEMSTRLDLLTVEQGLIVREGDEDDGEWALESSEEIEMRMAEVTLDDGTVCLNAGQGATRAFDDHRVNFTCDSLGADVSDEAEDRGEWVLLGDMTIEMDILTVERGLVAEIEDGFELTARETVYVVAVFGEEVEE